MNLEITKAISNTSNIICMLFIFILGIVYFKKKKVTNPETKIYSSILLCTFLSLIAELIFYYYFQNNITSLALDFFEKTYYITTLIWMYLISLYYFALLKPFEKSKIYVWPKNRKKMLITLSLIVMSVVIYALPIERIYENDVLLRSSGAAPSTMFILCIVMLIIDLMLVIIKKKKNSSKKNMPLFIFILIIVIELIISSTGTQVLLITLSMTLVCHSMYHTIENPDVKMLEEVSMAKEAAEKANHAKTEFLSNMSHEIRTPLNAIVGFSESLKDDNIPPESREKADDIITASQNLLEIVNGILDISKIEANKLEIINKEYDPYEMFKELESLARARMGDKGLEFQVSIDESIPHVLYGDNARVKQIILNILTNAIKYTKEGYVTFVVSSVVKDNVCRLIISVEDSGIGIKQESLPKLFSKFERLNVEKQLTIEGTGLGLAITKKLLDLMNGTIIVQSIYGKGSKFTISLDQRIISIEEPLEKKKPETSSTFVDANGARLLIVDDNEMNIKVATTLLKKYHFNITTCNSGLECIAKLKESSNYDIIFLDDMMPGMSGKQTLAKLKENEDFNIPVIALTANALTGMKEEYLNAGFNDYLSKPIEKPELERVIREFIQKDTKESINTATSMATNSILEHKLKEISDEKPKEILVIDSDVYSVKIIANIYDQFNINFKAVKTAEEAIISVIENKYDLVIIDEKLSDKTAFKLIEELKSIENFETPCVLMSTQKREDIKTELDTYGFEGYLSKPLNDIEVENIYASILKKK